MHRTTNTSTTTTETLDAQYDGERLAKRGSAFQESGFYRPSHKVARLSHVHGPSQ